MKLPKNAEGENNNEKTITVDAKKKKHSIEKNKNEYYEKKKILARGKTIDMHTRTQ